MWKASLSLEQVKDHIASMQTKLKNVGETVDEDMEVGGESSDKRESGAESEDEEGEKSEEGFSVEAESDEESIDGTELYV